ncbi:MAG: response regulator, partial [Blastocatellia bacterium]|nr:response regulator [Blastocatellia bacterium]
MKIFKKLFEGVDISTSSEKDRILLVETNDQDAFLRSAVLSDANYEISRAKNCLEAFKTLTSGINFQAVVTAFLLPDGTAIELLKRVQEQIPETVSIVVADEIDESLILEAMQAGASYCIPTF